MGERTVMETATYFAAVYAAAFAALSLLGLVVLAAAPERFRRLATPAAPVVGVSLVVVVLSATTRLLPVRWGLLALVPVLALLVVFAVRRTDRALPSWRGLAALLLAFVVGLPVAALTATPPVRTGVTLAFVGPSYDAYFYLATQRWLIDRQSDEAPFLRAGPVPGADSIADNPIRAMTNSHLRIGGDLVASGISTVTGLDPADLFFPLLCLWVGLVPGAVMAGFALLGLGRRTGVVAGLLTAAAPLTVHQVLSQNSPTILGLAMLCLVLTAAAARLADRSSVPAWLLAMVVGAWIATYTEYLVIGAPALVALVLVRPWRRIGPAALDAAVVAGLAVIMTPASTWRAVNSLLALSRLPTDPGGTSPFEGEWTTVVDRMGMASSLDTDSWTVPGLAGAVTLVVFAVGVLVLAIRGPAAGAAVGTVAAGVLGYLAYRDASYNQMRLVMYAMPLVVMFSVAGWRRLTEGSRVATVSAFAVAVAVGVQFGFVSQELSLRRPTDRVVDDSYAEAAGWVRDLGGPEGRDVTAVIVDGPTQLWLASALRPYAEVAYGVLDISYLGQQSYLDGRSDRYVLVDSGTFVSAPASAVVRENGRFRMLDTRGVPVVVVGVKDAAPTPSWFRADGGFLTEGPGRVFVWRTPEAPRTIDLTIAGPPDPVEVTVDAFAQPGRRDVLPVPDGSRPEGRATVGSPAVDIPVRLPDAYASVLLVQVDGADGALIRFDGITTP